MKRFSVIRLFLLSGLFITLPTNSHPGLILLVYEPNTDKNHQICTAMDKQRIRILEYAGCNGALPGFLKKIPPDLKITEENSMASDVKIYIC